MRRLLRVGAVLVAMSFVACAKDPRLIRITETNKDSFVEQIKDLKGLTVEESRLLFALLMRNSLSAGLGQAPPSLVGKTIGDLISEQRTFETDAKKREEDQARLAAEAKAKEDALAAELRKAINLTVFEKGFVARDAMAERYEDLLLIKCAYENTSGKDIRAFDGSVRLTDLFDKPVFESGLTISEPIRAGEKANWTGSIHYNQFKDSHRSLRNAELKDLKVVWLPKSIIYADGTKIGKVQE